MIVTVTGKGQSFKGAGLYYLHDKGAQSKARVAFTHTVNLATDNPNVAIAMMIHTAAHQDQIKRRAGGSARGRKLKTGPVYTYCLSWDPRLAPPTRQHMIDTAIESLAALGLDANEALLIAHSDEPHKHIHIIVNRIHPDTGIADTLSNDHTRLSAWAETYQRRHGLNNTPKRFENNARRRKGEYVKHTASDTGAAFHDWRKQRVEESFAQRRETEKELTAAHRAQRQALFADKEARIQKAKADLRAFYKPMWAALYRSEKSERLKLATQHDLSNRQLRHFLRKNAKATFNGDASGRSGQLKGPFAAASDADRQRRELIDAQEKGRAAFAARITEKQRNILKAINDDYKRDLADLMQRQQQQADELARAHALQSQETARKITAGEDRADYLKHKLPAAFRDAAADRDRTAPDFNRSAKDRPRPVRDFTEAAKQATERSSTTQGDSRTPDQKRREERKARLQRAIDRTREQRENAKDITNDKDHGGRDRPRTRRRTPPEHD